MARSLKAVLLAAGAAAVAAGAASADVAAAAEGCSAKTGEDGGVEVVCPASQAHLAAEIETGKPSETFRDYSKNRGNSGVYRHYHDMRSYQTLNFSRTMSERHHNFDHRRMTVWEALETLETYVDASDPDTSLPNKVHMLQTAYRMRKQGSPEWMQVVGLVHDIGKMLFLWGSDAEGQGMTKQYAMAGDTWVVGHPLPNVLIFPELNSLNPDNADPQLSNGTGIYTPGTGIANLEFAYGHDEYLYRMLRHNSARMVRDSVVHEPLPEEGLAMVRYHSCYPLHSSNAYQHLLAPGDEELIKAVQKFNQYDLYTKADLPPDYAQGKADFEAAVERYLPGLQDW